MFVGADERSRWWSTVLSVAVHWSSLADDDDALVTDVASLESLYSVVDSVANRVHHSEWVWLLICGSSLSRAANQSQHRLPLNPPECGGLTGVSSCPMGEADRSPILARIVGKYKSRRWSISRSSMRSLTGVLHLPPMQSDAVIRDESSPHYSAGSLACGNLTVMAAVLTRWLRSHPTVDGPAAAAAGQQLYRTLSVRAYFACLVGSQSVSLSLSSVEHQCLVQCSVLHQHTAS